MKITPLACLSRAIIGIIDDNQAKHSTMVVNLPGKPKAVTENMTILMKHGILKHALS